MNLNEEQIKQIIEYDNNWEKYEPTIPVIIPSYKNRKHCCVKNLDKISNNKIIIFVYEEDYIESGYNEFDNKPNVEFIKIKSDWRSIQKKRYFIQKYLADNRPDIHNYIMIDDDLNTCKIADIRPNRIKNCLYIPLINILGILEDLHLKYSNTISGGSNFEIQTGTFCNSNLPFKKQAPFYQHFVFNNDLIRLYPNIMFRDMQNVSEDNVIFFDYFNHNIDINSFPFIYIGASYNEKTTIASTPDNIKRNCMIALRIMKDKCKIHKSKQWPNAWAIKPLFDKSFNDFFKIKSILDSEPNDLIAYDLIGKTLFDNSNNSLDDFLC